MFNKNGQYSTETHTKVVKKKEPKIVGTKQSLASGNDFNASVVKPQKSKNVPLSHSNTVGPFLKRIKTNDKLHVACNLCGNLYKNGSKMNRHHSLHHSEMFFQAEKPIKWRTDSEGDQIFSKYVRFMLENQVDQEFSKITFSTLPRSNSLKESQAGGRGNIKFKCNFCNQALYDRQIAISHLVVIHATNMAAILKVGLKGKTVEAITMEMMYSETKRRVISVERKGDMPKCIVRRRFKKQLRTCDVPEM